MVKLVICLIFALVLSAVVLELRQQKLELNHQVNELHNSIEAQQARLWSQQLQIAEDTAPNALAQTVNERGLQLVPRPRPTAEHVAAHLGVDR